MYKNQWWLFLSSIECISQFTSKVWSALFNNIWLTLYYSQTVDGQFILSFTYRFEYRFSTVYFAFCYPYSYTEYQDKLGELDNKFAGRKYDSGW